MQFLSSESSSAVRSVSRSESGFSANDFIQFGFYKEKLDKVDKQEDKIHDLDKHIVRLEKSLEAINDNLKAIKNDFESYKKEERDTKKDKEKQLSVLKVAIISSVISVTLTFIFNIVTDKISDKDTITPQELSSSQTIQSKKEYSK